MGHLRLRPPHYLGAEYEQIPLLTEANTPLRCIVWSVGLKNLSGMAGSIARWRRRKPFKKILETWRFRETG